MTATLWSTAPQNRYAAERMGIAHAPSQTRDAFALRRRTTVVLASLFLVLNIAALALLTPVVIETVTSVVSLPDLAPPTN